MDGRNGPVTAKEWSDAAWAIQAWVASCFDVIGKCTFCGTDNPNWHINGCPWPQTRRLLDKDWH